MSGMKAHHLILTVGTLLASQPAFGHSWKAGDTDREILREHILDEWREAHHPTAAAAGEIKPLQLASAGSILGLMAAASANAANAPGQAKAFQMFPRLELKWDGDFLYVGSKGWPDHSMMVGITAWQQQVPLPQSYLGENAWRVPLHPVVSKQPQVVENHFLRGAIALAVNGIPIFNPQNNRGEVSYEIGELDQWGGHCGRADDYHYHIAPLHLESVLGKGMPVAYALDGYPIFGLSEPDGSPVGKLDECHGHEDSKIGYHYHASKQRPYLQSAFHGEVVEREEQVDPQPHAAPVRPSLPALRGAKINGFESTGENSYKLSYDVNGDKRSVSYSINADGTYPFVFDNGRDGTVKEVYTSRGQGGGQGRPRGGPDGPVGPEGRAKGKGKGGPGGRYRPDDNPPPPPGERRRPPRDGVVSARMLDANGDGVVTAVEFAEATKRDFAQAGGASTVADALQKARERFLALDTNKDGQLDRAELSTLVASDGPRGNPAPPPPRGDGPPRREDPRPRGEGGGGGGGKKGEPFVEMADQPRSSDGKFLLTSPVTEDLKEIPAEYTGDGEGASPPLEWKGAPAGTKSYALIMDHVAPGGDKKWYWTLWDIPASATSLPKNAQGIGKMGTGFKGEIGYEPPHSRGPGAKTYVITMYALSTPLTVAQSPRDVSRDILLAAMKDKVLASSSLRVVHTSDGNDGPGGGGQGGGERPRGEEAMNDRPPLPRNDAPPAPVTGGLRPLDNIFKNSAQAAPQLAQNTAAAPEPPPRGPGGGEKGGPGGKGKGGAGGGGKGGPDSRGLIKPQMSDAVHINVYADNWFAMFVNGELVAVDSIKFTPHNVVSLDILPEYPMTIAVIAKDNADWNTGMEYGDHIGDGGLTIKFSDGTVTDAKWKAMSFFKGPLDHDSKNPKVMHTPVPDGWWKPDFDDSKWPNATEYTEERVNPKEPYFNADFQGAKWIWSEDLDLDNTVIFRTKVEKPGWTKRWNTKPDIDTSGAPFK